MDRSAPALLALLLVNAGCVVRRPQTYRLVEQAKSSVLIPPGVASPDVPRRVFTADIPAGRGKCAADRGTVEMRPRGKRVRLTVDREALIRQAPGWLSHWTAATESRDCIAAGQGLRLGIRIIESLPLDPSAAYRLLYASGARTGYVDLGPEIRLQVNSPVLREGTPADAPAVESSKISGLTVEVKTSANLLGFEIAWYAVRPKPNAIGYEIVPISAERHVGGTAEAEAGPAYNYFQFSPQAAFCRLFYKADQGTTRIVVAGAATRAELDGAAQSLDSDPDACQKFGAGMCVVLPQHVAANPDVVAMVNGREVALPVGATVRSAVQAGGEKDPQRVLAQLHVRRLYGGKLVAVEFDRASQDIFGLTLLGGEEISWQ
ncbi:conserved hypothetical protein [Candidatus Sulfopaludibacter sp. SbA6]|nr:conserved hypothetical protein [Candidatus Sulfopaludibacter sp. SbA6]